MRYLFEDYALDTDRRELRRGTDLIALTPQVFDLLAYIIRNREIVVSKDDLIVAVWGGRIVSEPALTTRINAARTAIGDSGEQQRLIKTLPRKGIRFVGIVREEEKPVGVAATDHITQPPRASLTLPDKPSIAVPSFTNIALNDQAIRKAVKDAASRPRQEFRIAGVERLVLMTQPTGSGTFFVFYTSSMGKRRKLRLGDYHPEKFTLQQAKKLAIEANAAINRGGDPVGEAEARASAIKFKDLAERFLVENPDLAETTRRVYRYCLEKDVYPAIGDMPASVVTADHVVNIWKSIEKSGARVQSERTKTTIGGVYRWALREREGGIKENPCSGIGRRSHKVERTRWPSDDELATLWAAVEGQTGKLSAAVRLIIQLAILTSQRRTEICGARIVELQGLDTDNPVWVIPGDVNRRGKVIEGRTKNGREQRVPLSTQAAALFRKAIALSSSPEFVFPADLRKVKVGKAPRAPHIHGESVTMAMRRLRAEVGIDDISIHDMRRAVSNWLKDQGVSREVRDLILNHKDPSVTEAHYSNAARMEKQVRASLQAWADHVWSITGQGAPAANIVELKRA